MSESDIVKFSCPVGGKNFIILKAPRFSRKIRNINGEIEYKPTGTILLTFKGSQFPSFVSIFRVVCHVEPLIQKVIQCYNCLRYGHISKQCKGKTRCSKCGEDQEFTACQKLSNIICSFCKGPHLVTNHKACPEFNKQKSIKYIMANENISYKETVLKQENSFASVVITEKITFFLI